MKKKILTILRNALKWLFLSHWKSPNSIKAEFPLLRKNISTSRVIQNTSFETQSRI